MRSSASASITPASTWSSAARSQLADPRRPRRAPVRGPARAASRSRQATTYPRDLPVTPRKWRHAARPGAAPSQSSARSQASALPRSGLERRMQRGQRRALQSHRRRKLRHAAPDLRPRAVPSSAATARAARGAPSARCVRHQRVGCEPSPASARRTPSAAVPQRASACAARTPVAPVRLAANSDAGSPSGSSSQPEPGHRACLSWSFSQRWIEPGVEAGADCTPGLHRRLGQSLKGSS
jgi:hypothetical protein